MGQGSKVNGNMSWKGAKRRLVHGHGCSHIEIAQKLRGIEEDQRARNLDTIKTIHMQYNHQQRLFVNHKLV